MRVAVVLDRALVRWDRVGEIERDAIEHRPLDPLIVAEERQAWPHLTLRPVTSCAGIGSSVLASCSWQSRRHLGDRGVERRSDGKPKWVGFRDGESRRNSRKGGRAIVGQGDLRQVPGANAYRLAGLSARRRSGHQRPSLQIPQAVCSRSRSRCRPARQRSDQSCRAVRRKVFASIQLYALMTMVRPPPIESESFTA